MRAVDDTNACNTGSRDNSLGNPDADLDSAEDGEAFANRPVFTKYP